MSAPLGSSQGTDTARRILVRAAVVATICAVLYLLGLAGRLLVNGSLHAASSPGVQSISAVVALIWNCSLLVLFVSLSRLVAEDRQPLAEIAAAFSAVLCATSSVNWFVQLAVMPKLANAGESPLSAVLDVRNSFSITYSMEHLGWGLFFGLAALFAAAAFGRGPLEQGIRWLLAAAGLLSLVHLVGIVLASPAITDIGYIAWGLLLPLATALLVVRFRSR